MGGEGDVKLSLRFNWPNVSAAGGPASGGCCIGSVFVVSLNKNLLVFKSVWGSAASGTTTFENSNVHPLVLHTEKIIINNNNIITCLRFTLKNCK